MLRDVGPRETHVALGHASLLEPSGWCVRLRRASADAELAWHGGGRPSDPVLVEAGVRRVQIQCVDPVMPASFAMNPLVRTCRAEITYGREPFALGGA